MSVHVARFLKFGHKTRSFENDCTPWHALTRAEYVSTAFAREPDQWGAVQLFTAKVTGYVFTCYLCVSRLFYITFGLRDGSRSEVEVVGSGRQF